MTNSFHWPKWIQLFHNNVPRYNSSQKRWTYAGLPDGIFSNQKSQFGYILECLVMEDVGKFYGLSSILLPFRIFYWHLVYFVDVLVYFFPVLVCCTKKSGNPDLYTYVVSQQKQYIFFNAAGKFFNKESKWEQPKLDHFKIYCNSRCLSSPKRFTFAPRLFKRSVNQLMHQWLPWGQFLLSKAQP
jgi:hypothetical protein